MRDQPESRSPHVLLVDDEQLSRRATALMLERLGARVTDVPSGQVALDLLSQPDDFDLLITDLQMPDMNGLELIERANTITPELSKIILTGYDTSEHTLAALRLGAHDFLAKPLQDRRRLKTTVTRAAEATRLRRENLRQFEALRERTTQLESTVRKLAFANAVIRRHGQQMVRDLITAAQIQRGLLPQDLPAVDGFRFAARFEPSERVSGDFYQTIQVDPDHLLLIIADVAGHGVSAAMLTVFLSQSLDAALAALGPETAVQPPDLLHWLNRHFAALHTGHTPFVTLLCGHLDLTDGWIHLATAGHEPPLLQRGATGRVEPIEVEGIGLGLLPETEFNETIVDLSPGDRLLFYTDGLTEAVSADDELFGEHRLAEALASAPTDLEEAAAHIIDTVRRFAGTDGLEDDICLLLLERCPEK